MGEKLLPDDAAARREYPLLAGLLLYFPHACAAVAHHSHVSNEQHNPGEPMRWAKEKSIGTGDQVVRHTVEGVMGGEDSVTHLTAGAWRALELLERKLTGLPPFENGEQP